MRGTLETIVGAMFAGKTSELLKRILWAEHQGKKILVLKPKIDNRYSDETQDAKPEIRIFKDRFKSCFDTGIR